MPSSPTARNTTNNQQNNIEVEDKLHPSPRYAVGLVPVDSGGGGNTQKDQPDTTDTKKAKTLNYQRTLSAVDDDSDSELQPDVVQNSDQGGAGVGGSESLGEDIVDNASFPEEEVIFNSTMNDDSAVSADSPANSNNKKKKKNGKKKKKKAKQNAVATNNDISMKGEIVGNDGTIDVSPLKPSPTASSPPSMERSTVSQQTPPESQKNGKDEHTTGVAMMSLSDEEEERSSSSSKSSTSAVGNDASIYVDRTIKYTSSSSTKTTNKNNVRRKLDFVDHATQTPTKSVEGKITSTSTSSTTTKMNIVDDDSSVLPRTVRQIMMVAFLGLAVLAAFVVHDPSLPQKTVTFLRDVPYASQYKTRLDSTQHELWNVLAVREEIRLELDSLTNLYNDHVRQSQLNDAKWKTQNEKLTKQLNDETDRFQAQVDGINERVMQCQNDLDVKSTTVQHTMSELEQERKHRVATQLELEDLRSSLVVDSDDGDDNETGLSVDEWKDRYEQLQYEFEQQTKALFAARRDLEVVTQRMEAQVHQLEEKLESEQEKRRELESSAVVSTVDHDEVVENNTMGALEHEKERLRQRMMEDLEGERKEREQKLSAEMNEKYLRMEENLQDEIDRIRAERMVKLEEEMASLENDLVDDHPAAKAASNFSLSMTIGHRVDETVESLKAVTEQIQEKLVTASSSIIDIPIQSSEMVLLRGGVFRAEEPILPRNLPHKLKNTAGRMLEESKDGAIRIGVVSMKAANATFNKVESLSRDLLKTTHEILLEAEKKQEQNVPAAAFVKLNTAMGPVKAHSEQAFLLGSPWTAGETFVPKVVDRMMKSIRSKSAQGIRLIIGATAAARNTQSLLFHRTKELTKTGLEQVARGTKSSSTLVRKELIESRQKLSVATNTSIALLKKGAHTSRILLKKGLNVSQVELARAMNVSAQVIKKGTRNTRVLGTKASHSLKEMSTQGIAKIENVTSSSGIVLRKKIEQSQVVGRNAVREINKMKGIAVENLLRVGVEARKAVKATIRTSRRVGRQIHSRLRSGLQIGNHKLSQGATAAAEILIDAKHKSVVVGRRVGSGLKNLGGHGARKLEGVRDSTMMTFALAFP